MTKTVGLIGSGHIGSAVARLAVAAGLDVVLSNSRGPGTLAELVAELGPYARAATPSEPRSPPTWWWRPSRWWPTTGSPRPPSPGRP